MDVAVLLVAALAVAMTAYGLLFYYSSAVAVVITEADAKIAATNHHWLLL